MLQKPTCRPQRRPLVLQKPTCRPQRRPLVLQKPTCRPQRRPLVLQKPTCRPQRRPLVLQKPTCRPQRRPLVLQKPTCRPQRRPLVLQKPTCRPQRRPLVLQKPTCRPLGGKSLLPCPLEAAAAHDVPPMLPAAEDGLAGPVLLPDHPAGRRGHHVLVGQLAGWGGQVAVGPRLGRARGRLAPAGPGRAQLGHGLPHRAPAEGPGTGTGV